MTALDLLEIKELYSYPLYLHLDKGVMVIYFTKDEIMVAEDVGSGKYETLRLNISSVIMHKYMRVELYDGDIIKAIFERHEGYSG